MTIPGSCRSWPLVASVGVVPEELTTNRFRFDRAEEVLMRAGERPVDNAFVGERRAADKAIIAFSNALGLKLLARPDSVNVPEFCRQHNLPL